MKVKESCLRKLISEAILNEMNANELPSDINVEDDTKGNLHISFGKNGWGLSDEFLKIHEIVSKISQSNNIYLKSVKTDSLDDVYDFYFTYDSKDFDK